MDDKTIAYIEAHRARQIAGMLVTEAPAELANPERVLLDLKRLSGRELLDQYHKRHARFGTAPFDPNGDLLRFYPGGVTIWSGFPGAGKTTLLRQTICHFLARGSSVFLASLEEDPSDVLVRLAATASAGEPTAKQMQSFIDEYQQRFRMWGVIGIAQHAQLLAVITQLAAQGIRHAVIDSLMCLDVANDDFEGQRKFANLVSATARAAKIHIHLVAHPRKLISANQELDLNDVAGARELGGVADNVLFVQRRTSAQEYGPAAEVTPMCVAIRKQRHFSGALTSIEGWFDRRWKQFHREQFPSGATRYLPDDVYDQDPVGEASWYGQ